MYKLSYCSTCICFKKHKTMWVLHKQSVGYVLEYVFLVLCWFARFPKEWQQWVEIPKGSEKIPLFKLVVQILIYVFSRIDNFYQTIQLYLEPYLYLNERKVYLSNRYWEGVNFIIAKGLEAWRKWISYLKRV